MRTRFRGWVTRFGVAAGLSIGALVIASCGYGFRGRAARPTYAPPPVAYIDQRAPGGYMPPLRPPPLMRPPPTGPTLLSAPYGTAFVQSFFGAPIGVPTLPAIPFPWPFGGAPAAVPPGFPTPPPRVNSMASGPGCGEVNVGGVIIPVDCLTPEYGDIPWAARAILPDSIFRLSPGHAGAAALPQSVDHREEQLEGPVRFQGEVGACTAFSFAAAVDHALARSAGRPGFVSAMHVWSRYHYPSMALAANGNRKAPLTSEEAWPYTRENETTACKWVSKDQCKPSCHQLGPCTCEKNIHESACGVPVDPEQSTWADSRPVARVTTVTEISKSKSAIMEALAKGQDVWMAMRCDVKSFNALMPHDGLPAVIPDFDGSRTRSGHAMVISGYRVTANGAYFLLHNSWGERWGDHGYAWVHETTLMNNLTSAYTVDAEPIGPAKVPPRNETPTQCPEGLLPDSITAQCAPACPDGSARHNATCPDTTQCPAGYVNLYGECVVAAPTAKGMDPASKVRYNCAPGGCSYVVPFGFGGCFLPWCTVSCPSPRFRLTTDGVGMACAE